MRTQRAPRSLPTVSYLEKLARAERERRVRVTARQAQPAEGR